MPARKPRSNIERRRRILGPAFRLSDAEIQAQIAKRQAAERLQKAKMVRQYVQAVKRWDRKTIPFQDIGAALQFSLNRRRHSVPKQSESGVAYKIVHHPLTDAKSVLVLRLKETLLASGEKYFVFSLMAHNLASHKESQIAHTEAETIKREQRGHFHYTSVNANYKRLRIGTFLDYERTLKFLEEGIRNVSSGIDPTHEAVASADHRLYDKPGFSGIRRKALMTLDELGRQIPILRGKK
ncbi:MAG: hypothetical protein AABW72_00900 [archaeon]